MITREEEVSWAYLLDPCFQFENTAGKPLTGGYIEVYLHGTRDKYYCASDFNGTLHPFQIKLDSLGANIVLADPSNSYDVYVYNRYGNLVMSRYNVSTAHTGSGAYDRYDELENLIVSAVTGLQGEIDNIDEALEGKKDKQEVVSLTFTNTQTVSSIVQNENGELEITYQEIALPEQVPNIDIVSLASTISVTSLYDPETNVKTFNIDISDIGALEYGQYTAEAFVTTATMVKNKGNILVNNGKLKLRKGNSYHITVRGDYTSSDLDNTVQTIEYVEAISNNRIKIDVDNTVTDPQHFELSYDIFKLSNDVDYQIGFNQNTGVIGNLVLEIHSLSNVSVVNGGGGGEQVQADWTEEDPEEPSYIQHKPEIKDLVEGTNIRFREEEDAIYVDAVVTAIPTVTGFATHEEVYESSVTAVQLATAQIPELPDEEEVEFEEINLNDYALASAIPDISNLATKSEVYNSDVTAIQFVTALIPEEGVTEDDVYNATVTAIEFVTAIIPEAQVQSDWTEEDNTDPAYILNKPTEKFLLEGDNVRIRETNEGVYIDAIVTAIPVVTGFTTNADVYNATVTAVQLATSLIPEEQVQSDWNVTAIDSPAYIKNKPEILDTLPIKAGDNISLEVDNDELVISVTGEMGRTYTAGDYVSIQNDVISVTGVAAATAIPDSEEIEFEEINLEDYALASAIPEQVQSDWAATGIDEPDYIKNKPTITPLIEGSNIHFTETVDGIMISASMPPASGTVTEVEVYNATVTAVQLATGQIPDVSDFVTEDQVTALLPDSEEVEFEEINLSDYALASAIPDVTSLASKSDVYNATVTGVQLATAQIPDVTGFATKAQVYNATVTAINTVTSIIPEAQVQSDWNVTAVDSPAYIKNKPEIFENLPLRAGEGIGISIDNDEVVVAVTAQYLTEIPSTYATDTEVYNATVTGVQLATAQIPDVSTFATKTELATVESEIPVVTGFATKADLDTVSGMITPELPVVAGDGIGITETESEITIAVTANFATQSDIAAVTALIPTDNYVKVITDSSSTSQVTYGDLRALCEGHAEFDLFYDATYPSRRYLYRCSRAEQTGSHYEVCFTTVPISNEYEQSDDTYGKYSNKVYEIYFWFWRISDDGPSDDTIAYIGSDYVPGVNTHNFGWRWIQADWNETDTLAQTYIKNKPNLSSYASKTELTSVSGTLQTEIETVSAAIPDTSDMATETWVDNQGYLTSIPSNYVTETELTGAVSGFATKSELSTVEAEIPVVTGFATKTEVTTGLGTKQNTLTGITDVQVVNSLPGSPVATVLYLIPEV